MANINVTYEEMNNAAHRLDQGREHMVSVLGELKSLIDNLVAEGFTTQLASGAFTETYEKFTSGTTQAVNGLEGMAGFLRGAATAMQSTDEQLARAIKN